MALTFDLSCYLLENGINDPADALDPTDLKYRSIKDGLGFTGRLYFRVGDEHLPGWAALVQPNLKGDTSFFPESKSISAVLFVKTANAHYAYTFGGGWSWLKRTAYVADFGKKTVLSIVDPQKGLHSVDLRAMRDQPLFTRQQATRGTRLQSFGVDTLQDRLRAVTGEPLPAHAGLAKRVTGADVLKYRAKLEFKELGARSDAFLTQFNLKAYKNVSDFKWVDQVTLIRAPQRIDALDALMLARVKQTEFEVAPPDMIDWGRAPAFGFSADTAEDDRIEFISADALMSHFGAANINALTVQQLKDTRIYCFYDNEPRSKEHWPAYDCIELDVVDQDEQYTFGAGHWSVVEPDFLGQVDDYVAELQQNGPALPNAEWAHDANPAGDEILEPSYITRICGANTNYAKIHECGQEVKFGGAEVELCDVYDVAGDLIHLKRWSSSQTFSALAMQAANASEFLTDAQFAADARGLVQHVNPAFDCLPAGFDPRQYRIVLGLIRRQTGEIPFFSRLTLMRAAQRIRSHFFRAAFVSIPVQ